MDQNASPVFQLSLPFDSLSIGKGRGKLHQIICAICGKIFWVKKQRIQSAKYCSRKCQGIGKKKRIKKICLNCRKEFEVRPSEVKRMILCSWKCRKEYRVGENAIRPKQRFEARCEWCGKKMYLHKYKKDHPHFGRFCSQKCLIKWRTNHQKRMGHLKKIKMIYICKTCDKKFIGLRSSRKRKKYCSITCKNKNWQPMAWSKRPTNIERMAQEIFPPSVCYVGNGKYRIKLSDGHLHNPDFKVVDQNKVVEIWGDYWHRNQDPQKLIELFKSAGLKCLIIRENEFYQSKKRIFTEGNKQAILEKLNLFLLTN